MENLKCLIVKAGPNFCAGVVKNSEKEDLNTEDLSGFCILKKKEPKSKKKSFALYLYDTQRKKLDKICKDTGHSKNELITMMIEYCFEHIEYDF